MVGSAGQGNVEARRAALTLLVKSYLPVLRWHLIGRRNIKPDQVDDLLQEFLLSKILESDILRLADQKRGRFRTFLATALDRFVINQQHYESAAKRSPHRSQAITEEVLDRSDADKTPFEMIDYFWARQVLGQAIRHMRTECIKKKRSDLWMIFRSRILGPTLRNAAPVSFAKLAENSGVDSTNRASHLLATANRWFAHSLRAIVGRYDRGKQDIDDEIQDLWHAISKEGRKTH